MSFERKDNSEPPKTPKSFGSAYNPSSATSTQTRTQTPVTASANYSIATSSRKDVRSQDMSPSVAADNQASQLQHSKRYSGMSTMDEYEIMNDLGKGTFGVVSKAKQKSTNKLVALKQLIIHDSKDGFPITAFREITIMKKFKHGNVLQLIDMIHETSKDPSKTGCFYTVTPYMSSDLNGLLHNPRVVLTISQKKCILMQLLEGINYIHGMNFLHRDIKTANILLDYFGVVKIADFGLARVYHGPPPKTPDSLPGGGKYEYTGLVVTRWYRPPELLLGERKYTTAVDMWGIGCVMGELYKRTPILEGKSDLDQADIIFKLVGPPTDESMPGFKYLKGNGVNTNVNYKRTLETTFSEIGPKGLPLLAGLLRLDQKTRFNAAKALAHEFFTSPPLPCKPSDLPKFEESHEADVHTYKQEVPNRESSFSPSTNANKTTGSGWSKPYNGNMNQRSSWVRTGPAQQHHPPQYNRTGSNGAPPMVHTYSRGPIDTYNRDWNKPRPAIPPKPSSAAVNTYGESYSANSNNNIFTKSPSSSSLAKLKSVVHGTNGSTTDKRKTEEIEHSEDGESNKRSRR